MRPIFLLFIPILYFAAGSGTAQEALVTVLRQPFLVPDQEVGPVGFNWCGFSRQYYLTAGWNETGIGATYKTPKGESSAILVRDGISGFSWSHLYLSHQLGIGRVRMLLQIRFSLITVIGQPPVFRTGGHIGLTIPAGESLHLGFTVFDFPGFLFPHAAPVRGDPTIRLQLWHTPGRQFDLTGAFDLSTSCPGPLILGIRLNASDQVRLSGQFRVLPLGLAIGMEWRINQIKICFGFETTSRLGVTPLIIAQGPITGNRQPVTGSKN
ncbi:MAG: hypothetical protein A2X22_01150 [Bacteroidetes bacterium GWF2_49_14]|nr:MAG: hypothetical protein A2X22_01150 [Bacteroidetes bacterium GWF2_49_14]